MSAAPHGYPPAPSASAVAETARRLGGEAEALRRRPVDLRVDVPLSPVLGDARGVVANPICEVVPEEIESFNEV